jgi:hypothetical protein
VYQVRVPIEGSRRLSVLAVALAHQNRTFLLVTHYVRSLVNSPCRNREIEFIGDGGGDCSFGQTSIGGKRSDLVIGEDFSPRDAAKTKV